MNTGDLDTLIESIPDYVKLHILDSRKVTFKPKSDLATCNDCKLTFPYVSNNQQLAQLGRNSIPILCHLALVHHDNFSDIFKMHTRRNPELSLLIPKIDQIKDPKPITKLHSDRNSQQVSQSVYQADQLMKHTNFETNKAVIEDNQVQTSQQLPQRLTYMTQQNYSLQTPSQYLQQPHHYLFPYQPVQQQQPMHPNPNLNPYPYPYSYPYGPYQHQISRQVSSYYQNQLIDVSKETFALKSRIAAGLRFLESEIGQLSTQFKNQMLHFDWNMMIPGQKLAVDSNVLVEVDLVRGAIIEKIKDSLKEESILNVAVDFISSQRIQGHDTAVVRLCLKSPNTQNMPFVTIMAFDTIDHSTTLTQVVSYIRDKLGLSNKQLEIRVKGSSSFQSGAFDGNITILAVSDGTSLKQASSCNRLDVVTLSLDLVSINGFSEENKEWLISTLLMIADYLMEMF
ncbi:hypothetical protein CANARDRAFT_28128 [[Candida] arabinofermentans NRRL YB-2248]|uniref:Uncharacterized protein n=1 Tax=[Candida] arabinofermentans NRRL YB-2248 TaxID=983967 RepID=A0A1E4T323_9ASCO|nr:hypothetical protein CANARDRAFT_28128 [[Candida] arabinofermentans NRRL YB-2248]